MGRSFDRGGQSRKERMRGKRRAFQQAERDREARDAVRQARHNGQAAAMSGGAQHALKAASSTAAPATVSLVAQVTQLQQPAVATAQKQPGFLTRAFSRLFGKAA